MDAIERMVHNATPWDYPMDLHLQLCTELRICPEVYIVPGWMKKLFVEHFQSDDGDTDAFADDNGNCVYFYEDYWTAKYKLWLVHHEMFHQSQFYDRGNCRDRWIDLASKDEYDTWEREAEDFANSRVGVLGKKVKRYSRQPDNLIDPRFADKYVFKQNGDQASKDGTPRFVIRGRRR